MKYYGCNCKETKTCFHCMHGNFDPGCCSSFDDPGYPPYVECEGEMPEDEFELVESYPETHPGKDYEDAAEECKYFQPILVEKCCNCDKPLGVPQWNHKFWALTPFTEVPVCSDLCKEELEDKADKQSREVYQEWVGLEVNE